MANASTVGRPFATTPGVPAERVAALRAAFDATIRDPEFIVTAKKENMEIRPQTAEVLTQVVLGLLSSPQDVRDRMKVALQPRDEHTQEIKVEKK
jgi:tripartite-type tricarboxylate transporter receptor subunit TctC